MPRGPRLDASGVLQHVMARGIERRKIFRDSHNRGDLLVRTGSHPLAMNVVTSSISSPVLFDTKPYALKGASTSITRFRPMPRVLPEHCRRPRTGHSRRKGICFG